MELTWTDNRDRDVPMRLDVTYYYKGFERGLSKSLVPISDGGKFEALSRPKVANTVEPQVELVSVQAPKTLGRGRFEVAVDGLKPGMNHNWQLMHEVDGVWTKFGSVECIAAVCPVDKMK